MADSVQINPKITLPTKARLVEWCHARNYSQSEVVEAALEAYFTPAEDDAQTLLFAKVNALEQGMKDVVGLLATVIQHLERQALPPEVKRATAAELYPTLHQPLVSCVEDEAHEEPPAPVARAWWQRVRGRTPA